MAPSLFIVRRVVVSLIVITAVVIGLGVLLRWLSRGLGAWDLRTLTDIVRWRRSAAVDVARVASWGGRSWVLVPVAVAAGWLLRGRGRGGGTNPVASVVVAIIAQNVVKVLIRRPRPPVVHLQHVTSWSFPSGHAAESTALLTSLVIAAWPALATRRARGAALVTAAALEFVIAASRLVLGVHYPTDVAAGLLLGSASAALCAVALPRAITASGTSARAAG